MVVSLVVYMNTSFSFLTGNSPKGYDAIYIMMNIIINFMNGISRYSYCTSTIPI